MKANKKTDDRPQQEAGRDYTLLLQRLEKAPLSDDGNAFVARALQQEELWQEYKDDELLRLARVAQEHGLHDIALRLLEHLNRRWPKCVEGWMSRATLLQLLGRHDELARFVATMSKDLPEEHQRQLRASLLAGQDTAPKGEERVIDPFTSLRQKEEEIKTYMQLFRGRSDAFARQWVDKEQGRQGYVPVQRPLTSREIEEHLDGRRTYGIYLLDENNAVWTGVIDIDLVSRLRDIQARKKARDQIRREAVYLFKRIRERAEKAGLREICEISGGKGYHLWFPASGPVAAGTMKKAMLSLASGLEADCNCFHLEVFPKQSVRSGKGYGNLVKLPLGVHRATGRPSRFLPTASADRKDQFALLQGVSPALPERFARLAATWGRAEVVDHPLRRQAGEKYPELDILKTRCRIFAQLFTLLRTGRQLGVREEKVLLGVLSHLPRGRLLLHHLCSGSAEYNRPLMDYKISRIRGSVLGCKRIHSLLDEGPGDLPCEFRTREYPHPLLHLPEEQRGRPQQQVSEKATNLTDALLCLKTAIAQIERFL